MLFLAYFSYLEGKVSDTPSLQQLLNQLTNSHEILYDADAIGDHIMFVLFNCVSSFIALTVSVLLG